MQNGCIKIIKIILFAFCLVTASAHAAESFIIDGIKIEGLERLTDGTLLNYLPVQEGDPLDDKQIVFAIKELYKTGFFTDVQLLREGNTLLVRVKERPSISEVTFSGNSDIDDKTLEDALKDIGILKGRIYNRSLLEQLSAELERVYFSQGKYGIRITTKVTELDQNRVDIDIEISEGRVALIKQINIIGNEVFDNDTLLDEIELGSSDDISVFSSADEYSKPKLNADLETLRSYYMDRGYIKFSSDSTQVSITPDKKDIYVTINIEEGEQYSISDVTLTGEMVIDKAILEALITTKPGEIFSRKEMTTSQKALQDRLGKIGYAFAKVNIAPQVDDDKREIALAYIVEPGRKVYVRQINFRGNFKTHDVVLRRELRLLEGSVLASDRLERSKIRLQRLSYLEEVKINTVPVPGTADQVDLDVSVEERLSGSFNIGAGFSQTQGFLFNIGLTQENLFGTGQRLAVDLNTDSANTVYSVSFTDPYYTLDGVSRTISASFRDRNAAEEDITNFETSTYSANVNYGIPLSEYNTLRLGYGVSHIELRLSSNPSDVVTDFVSSNGSVFDSFILSTSFTHDTRNRSVFATEGSSQYLGLDVSVPGSDLEYYKLSYNTKFYFDIGSDLVLLLRSNLAYGNGYGSDGELPFFERYFAGGLSTVRGYESNSLGPRDNTGEPIGGNMRVTAGADLVFPIPFVEKAPKSVRFSAFYDIGNVYLDDLPTFDSDLNGFDSSQLRTSVGLSFVWLAPIGPLRFSWAKALNDVPGDNLRNFQFSIGSFF
ncbi:MAG: outer membrane protein assembly factor BamA [Gammaproteobacteria bacterium]